MDFFEDYKTYVGKTELPESFITWGAIAALAATTAHNVCLKRGKWDVKPNLYIINLSLPGVGKSFALNFATRLIKLVGSPMVAPSAITIEALYLLMSADKDSAVITEIVNNKKIKKAPLFVASSELITLLGTEPLRMVEFLTDLWDSTEFKVVTKNKGTNVITNPCLTLLGCMTPGKMDKQMSQAFLAGGFSRRCIFVSGTIPATDCPFLETLPEQAEAELKCVAFLKEVSKIKGEFEWAEEAKIYYADWYAKNKKLLIQNQTNVLGQYYSTMRELILKVAMLVALTQFRKILLASDLEKAQAFLEPTVQAMQEVFSSAGANPLQPIAIEILKLVQQRRTIKKSVLAQLMFQHADSKQLDACLSHLVDTGQIKVKIEGGCCTVLAS